MKKLIALFPQLLFLLILISSCKRNNIHFLQADGADFIHNLSTGRSADADSPYAPMIPVAHGDMVWLPAQCFFKFSGEKDMILHFKSKGPISFIDDHLASVDIEDDGKILDTVQSFDLTGLRSIYFTTPLTPSMIPALKKISAKRPDIGVIYTDETDTTENMQKDYKGLATLLNLFDPDWLITYIRSDQIGLLSSEQQMDMLYLMPEDSVINYKLPSLKKLRHLTVVSEDAIIPADFLDNNPQITDLVIQGEYHPNMFSNLKKIRSISINSNDNLNLELKYNDVLERLIITGAGPFPAKTVSTYRNLSWLSIPGEESQAQFDSIAKTNPDITVIELSGDSLISNISGAQEWNKLKAMVIYGDTMYHKTGLNELKQLKLLSVPKQMFNDKKMITQLRRSLPNTTIVPNNGGCVGSGWLLLLVPLVLALEVIIRKRMAA